MGAIGKFTFRFVARTLVLLSALSFLAGCQQGFEPVRNGQSSSLNQASFDISGEKASFSQSIGISYGFIGEVITEHFAGSIKELLRQQGCENAGSSSDTRPAKQQYRCGEIPVGDILGADKKLITSFPVAAQSGVQDGASFTVGAGSFPIYMTRTQRRGSIRIADLDNWNTRDIATSEKIGEQIFIRNSPVGGQMESEICAVMPGATVYSDPQVLSGSLSKEEFFTTVKSDFEITVDIGRITFDSANVCVKVKTTAGASGLDIQIVEVKKPVLQNLQLQGYKSNVEADVGGLLGSLSGILSAVGLDIEKIIEKAVKEATDDIALSELEKIESGDLDTGAWLAKFTNAEILQNVLVKDLVEGLTGKLESNSSVRAAGGTLDVSDYVAGACLAIVDEVRSTAGLDSNSLYNVCRMLPKVGIDLFKDNAEMRELGCYDYFYDPMNAKHQSGVKKWWYSDCQLVQSVQIEVPEEFAGLYTCIFNAIENKTSLIKDGCALRFIQSMKSISAEDLAQLRVAQQRLPAQARIAIERIVSLAVDYAGRPIEFSPKL